MRSLSQSEASIQKRTSTAKFARSPCTDPQVGFDTPENEALQVWITDLSDHIVGRRPGVFYIGE